MDDDDGSIAKTEERGQLASDLLSSDTDKGPFASSPRPDSLGDDDTSPSHGGTPRNLLLNSTINGYALEGVLGRGAAGIVYRAQHRTTGRKAAFKVLKPEFAEEPEYIRRLIEEARALTAIRHKGIIDILDFGALPSGQPYLVMELCDGLSLEEQLKFSGKPPLREAVGMIVELLDALAAAHERGIIHRDLKPSNLFLASVPNGPQTLKVLDFGLARRGDVQRGDRPTLPGTMLGTPDYMSPEQIEAKAVGPFTDVYAAGGIAFKLLTHRLPFTGSNAIAVIAKKMSEAPPRVRVFEPNVPATLDALVNQMLERRPEDRPTVAAARAGFAAFLSGTRRGPVPSLMDDDASSKPTGFHEFVPGPVVDTTLLMGGRTAVDLRLPGTHVNLQAMPPGTLQDPNDGPNTADAIALATGRSNGLLRGAIALVLVGAAIAGWFLLRG